jgi:hypothetical protein
MGRPKVIHTFETILARTDEVGDCLEWQGIMSHGTPQIRIDRKLLSVRRVIREMQGKPASADAFLASSCGNKKCVNPEHIAARTKSQHMQAMSKLINHNHPVRIAKLQKAKASERVLDDEGLAMVMTDPRRAQDVAEQLSVSKSLVNRIRRGTAYRQVNASMNPFSGLIFQGQ